MGGRSACPFETTLIYSLIKKWQDAGNPEGMWFNEILFNIVRKMWFKSSKDDGILYSTHFDPVQPETMALTYTAVCSGFLSYGLDL